MEAIFTFTNRKNIIAMLKNLCLLPFLLMSFAPAYSQDTIYKTNGEIVIAKILEVWPNEVKFKKFDFMEGPVFIENKSELKKINYFNGLKEVFEKREHSTQASGITPAPINFQPRIETNQSKKILVLGNRNKYQDHFLHEKELHDLLLKTGDRKIMAMVEEAKDAKSMQYLGFLGIPLGITSYIFVLKSAFGSSNGSSSSDLNIAGVCFLGAIVCPLSSIAFKIKRRNYNREAVVLYNQKF